MSRCHGCRKPIQGSTIQAMNRSWHAQCFVCGACGQPIGESSFAVHRDRPMHPDCFAQKHAPRCRGCSQPIVDAGVTALGGTWHPSCFTCGVCGQPIQDAQFAVVEEQAMHHRCYREKTLPRCSVCGEPVTQQYLKNPWGEQYCAHHPKQLPACSSCGRLVCARLTGGGIRLDDGRPLCNICAPHAIYDESIAAGLFRQTAAELANMGFHVNDVDKIPLQLVPKNAKVMKNSRSGDTLGTTMTREVLRNNKVVGRTVTAVCVLYGLPAPHFCDVAAHELGHVFLGQQQLYHLKPKVEEGFCVLIQYLRLQQKQDADSRFRLQQIETNTDKIYGEGFRQMRARLEKMGWPRLTQWLKDQGRKKGWFWSK